MKMAQSRKIDAAFFESGWVTKLVEDGEAHFVLLFLYLIITCRNPVGIFDENVRKWNFDLNPPTPFKKDDVFVKFGKRIRRIEGHPEKGIIVGFCDFQRNYGQQSRQWAWIVKDLEAVGLTYEALQHFDEEAQQPELDLGVPPPLKKVRQAGEVPRRNIIPPKEEWVRGYFTEQGMTLEAGKFYDYWTSVGWKRGGRLMVDWEASARTWISRCKGESQQATGGKAPVRNVVGKARKMF